MANPDLGLLTQAVQLLMTGADYHSYRDEQHARMDDILVRTRAANIVIGVRDLLEQRLAVWREAAIPPSTREQPFPDSATMKTLRRARRCIDELMALQTRILTAPTARDDVWSAVASRQAVLEQLLQCDIALLEACKALEGAAHTLQIESCDCVGDAGMTLFDGARYAVGAAIQDRAEPLLAP